MEITVSDPTVVGKGHKGSSGIREKVLSDEEFQKNKGSLDLEKLLNTVVIKKDHFIFERGSEIFDFYDLDDKKPIGEGAFGHVYKATEKDTGIIRAVKMIPKENIIDEEQFFNEVNSLKTLDHPNVVKLLETYKAEKEIFLVQEYCCGGELFDYIYNRGNLTEKDAARIF